MTKETVQKLADSENITLNGDFDYFKLELRHWLKSLCEIFEGFSFCGGEAEKQ